MTTEGDELPFDWAALVPRVVHPVRVAIIEAMHWVGQPITATDMVHMFNEELSVSHLSYHFRILASPKTKVIKEVRRRPVRGAEEKFFYFRDVSQLM